MNRAVRSQIAVGGMVVAIAFVLTFLFARCGHDAASERTAEVRTTAETSFKECETSLTTLSVDFTDATKRGFDHDRAAGVIGLRVQLCDSAGTAIQAALDARVWHEEDMVDLKKRDDAYRDWLHDLSSTLDEANGEAGSASDAALHKLRDMLQI